MGAGLRVLKLQQKLIARNQQLDRTHKHLSKIHGQLEDDLRAAAKLQQVNIPPDFHRLNRWAIAFRPKADGTMCIREPDELMAELNHRCQDDSDTDQYFTMVYAIIDRSTGKVRMCQAGHPSPLVLRGDGTTKFIGEGGAPVGLFPLGGI